MTITLDGTLGVTTPAETITGTLAVTGITTVAAGTALLPSIISTTGTADTGQWFPAADTIAWSTAGTERMRIDSSGNVGIGTSAPAKLLSVQYPYAKTDTASRIITVFKSNDASNANELSISALGAAAQASRVWFFQTAENSISNAGTISLQSSGGNVSIGGEVAARILSVQYPYAKTDTTKRYMFVLKSNEASNANEMLFSSVGAATQASRVWNIQTGEDGVSNAGTIALQPDGGSVGIGTTTASSRLTIKQSADGGAGGITLVRQANTNNWQAVVASTNDLYLIYNGTDRGYFSNTNGAYTSISDKRLKENIFKIPYGLNSVLALNPVQYNMIGHEANQLGFIAQEVQEIIPESVSEMMGGNLGMDKSSIIPVLVKAIQEQQVIIETLTARITALETE